MSGVEDLGWAGRVMQWLRVATTIVGVHVLWLAGTLLGLVLLGVGPATAAASSVLEGVLRGRPSERPVRDFVGTYRTRWVRANLALVPFWLIAAVGLLDVAALQVVSGPGATALAYGLGLVGLYALAALAFLYPVDERSDGVRHTWKVTLLAPALFPMTAAGALLTIGALGLVVWTWPIVAVLAGASLPIALTGRLVRHRLDLVTEDQAETTAAGRAGRL